MIGFKEVLSELKEIGVVQGVTPKVVFVFVKIHIFNEAFEQNR